MAKRLLGMAVLLTLLSSGAWASGFDDTFAFGARALALGGAFTGVADDYSAAYYNQAALATQSSNSLTLDYLYAVPQLDVKSLRTGGDLVVQATNGLIRTDPEDYRDGGSRGMDLKAPIVGATLDVNAGLKLSNQISLGVVLSPTHNHKLYSVNSFPPDQPHFIRYGDNLSRLHVVIAGGLEVVPDILYVGGGTQSYLMGDGSFYMDNLTMTVEPQSQYVVNQGKQSALMKFAPMASVMLTLMDKHLKIGFTARDNMQTELDPIPVMLSPKDSGLGIGFIMGLTSMYSPEEFATGVSFTHANWMVAVDATVQKWSKYRYAQTDRRYYQPDSTDNYPRCSRTPEFDDTLNLRLGFEYKLKPQTSLMLGYAYQPSPVPNQSNRVTNYLDADKHMFSTGLSHAFRVRGLSQPLKLSASCMYQQLETVRVYKSDAVEGKTWKNQESYELSGYALAGLLGLAVTW